MDNSVTKISDLPTGNNQIHTDTQLQNKLPPPISVSENKNKMSSNISTNYKPLNVHANPYGISDQNAIIDNTQNTQQVPFEYQEQFQQQIQNMPHQKLPSRDIPMSTETYITDEQIQPNHIPNKNNNIDYVRSYHDMTEEKLLEHKQIKHREQLFDSIINDLQLPIFISLLYFLFQLPIIDTLIIKKISFLSLIGNDGEFNFNGLLLKSLLFGYLYYITNKTIQFLQQL